ncbi:unnamed protein product [Symbiodinium microadriaticum]|nr:unnamed protein product [Symbiodinium microadriaticum]
MDGRLAALREELVARKDKWEAYKLEMQQAYQVERNRFSADVGRLEQEIAEMAKSQEESHRNITAAAASGTGQREHMATAVAEEWQALCASQDVPASALSQELMRMAAILSGGGSGSASAMPTTPPHRPAGGLPLTPPSVSGNGGGTPKMGTATDPYMVGTERPPEATADGATPAALGSASRAAHGQRPRPAEGGYRKAVKPAVPPAPKTAPSPSLGDKLWEKRLKEQEDARTALLPFRRRGGTEPGTHEGAENAGPDPPPVEDMHRAGTHEISEDSEMDALELSMLELLDEGRCYDRLRCWALRQSLSSSGSYTARQVKLWMLKRMRLKVLHDKGRYPLQSCLTVHNSGGPVYASIITGKLTYADYATEDQPMQAASAIPVVSGGASPFLDFLSKDFCVYLQMQAPLSIVPRCAEGAPSNKFSNHWNRSCKLLTEPVSYNHRDEDRSESLRFCADAFGEDWFFIDPWDLREYHLLPLPPFVPLPLVAPTEVAFALLSPEYCHEHIVAIVNLPAELDDMYQALQVARCPDKARRSSFYIEVAPQPESAWGVLIVVPLWARFERIICLDLRSIDGRLFACNAPVTADRFAVLFLADLPLNTECEIYVGGMQFPLQDGAQVYLNQGDLVTLVPPGREAPAYYDLEEMLQTPLTLTWEEGQLTSRCLASNRCLSTRVGYAFPSPEQVFLFKDSLTILTLSLPQVLEVMYVPVDEDEPAMPPVVGSDNEDSDWEDDGFEESSVSTAAGSSGLPGPEAEDNFGVISEEPTQWQRTLLCSVQVLGVEGMHFSMSGVTTREMPPPANSAPVAISLLAMLPPGAELRAPACGDLNSEFSVRAIATPSRRVCGSDKSRLAVPLLEGRPMEVSDGGFPAHPVVNEDFQTLLEESVQSMQGYPLFLACTLLETLTEHFHEVSPQVPPARSVGSLVELCPRVWPGANHCKYRSGEKVTTFDRTAPLSFGSVPIGFSTEQLHALFKPAFTCLSLAECAQAIPSSLRKQFVSYASGMDPNLPAGPVCFVDGSFRAEQPGETVAMGWSCVFVDSDAGMCGILAAQMPQWAMDMVEIPSAFRAECCALIVGYWIGVSVWNEKGFSILSDCQSAIDIAQGRSATRTDGIAQEGREDIWGSNSGSVEIIACCDPRRLVVLFKQANLQIIFMGSVAAWTEPAITAANMVIDHVATLVDIQVQLRCGAGNAKEVTQQIDVSALVHPDNRATLEGILANAPRPSWEVSAHVHTAQIAGYLQRALAKAFPRPHSRPLHPFLSETAWDLQHQVAWLRRKCAHIKQVIRRQTLLAVFGAWQGNRREAEPNASAWLRDAQVAEALYGFRLGCFAKALRSRCKADRASYMSELADQVQNAPDAAYKAVSKLLCRRRKQPFAPAVLPSVLEADGSLCQTPEDTTRRWRQHFSALEAGEDRTPEELIQQLTSKGERAWPCPASLASIPTPLDVQTAARAAQRGKACGPDQIPGELGIICPQGLQQACAIVFADVASAYYATRRELAARHPDDEVADEGSSASHAEADSLEGQLARPSALAQQSAEPWLRALTTVLNEDTWMRLQGDTTPVATYQGTRPGSAWADLTFGVLVARILSLKRKLKGEDGCAVPGLPVAWDGCRSWSPRGPDSHTAYITDLVWADDVSSPVAVDDVHELAKAVGVEVGTLAVLRQTLDMWRRSDAFCDEWCEIAEALPLQPPRGRRPSWKLPAMF